MSLRLIILACLLSVSMLTSCFVSAADGGQTDGAKALPLKSYQIRNVKYGDLLRPKDANAANGTPIVLYPAQPWKCMTWRFHPAGESRFQLQNHFTFKTFSAENAGKVDGAVTQVPFSKKADERPVWEIIMLKDGSYKIAEAGSGKALTAVEQTGSSGVRVVVQDWQNSPEQKWELKEIDPKELTM